jgi:HK97 family phage portal protein
MLETLLGKRRTANPQGRYDGYDRWWPTMSRRTKSNLNIDEDKALNYSAVWCASRILMEGVGSLPPRLYQRTPEGHRELSDDPRYYVAGCAPNPRMPAFTFWEGRTLHQVNHGNGFAEIDRDRRSGELLALWPIHPGRVKPVLPRDNLPGFDYRVRNNDGSYVNLRASEMLHIPGAGSEDGIWGKGVITLARESVGMGIATEEHGAAYFGGGCQPRGIVTGIGLKEKEDRANFREEWKEIHGSPDSGEIAILPTDAGYTPITLSNEDSQFIGTRKHNITEFARWYRVPPHMLMDLERATFSNIEHQRIEFVENSLVSWLYRIAGQLDLKLLTEDERKAGYYFGYDLTALLRGDFETRMRGYQVAIQTGILTLNDVLRAEGRNTIGPEGDERFMPLNITTLKRLVSAQPEQSKPPPFQPRESQP